MRAFLRIVFSFQVATPFANSFASSECESAVASESLMGPSSEINTYDRDAIRTESHLLTSLIEKDPAKNLVYQHPFIIMNAAQRLHSFNNKHRPIKVVKSGFAGGIGDLYPLYQSSLPENDGEYIEGHYDTVRTLVESIAAAARGDGSASKTVTLVGGAGTGKTKFLEIFSAVGKYNTSRIPKFYMYSFEWKNLKEIKNLRAVLDYLPELDGDISAPLQIPFYQSPIALLPKEYLPQVVGMASDKAVQLSGVLPTPVTILNPQNQFIRDAVVDHYAARLGKSRLSPEEIVKALTQYVNIKRHVLSDNGRTGKIGYQGTEIDWAGLTFTENPMIKLKYGSSHPFAYHYDGALLTAGDIICFDEFWRNPESFRDFTLDLQENKILQRGGSAKINLDVVIFAASNKESLKKATGGDGTQTAQVDRSRTEWMQASVDPQEITRTMLPMKSKFLSDFFMVPLRPVSEALQDSNGIDAAPIAADLNKLYPLRTLTSDPYPSPDRRFQLFYRTGPGREPVLISPWSLAYMSYVVAATRMVTDIKKAEDIGRQYGVTANSQVFRDEVQRLKALMGQTQMQAGTTQDLKTLSSYLEEGSEGVTTRDAASIWLTESINAAQRDGNDNTITPTLVRNVFVDLLPKPQGLKPKNNQERLRWLRLLDRIALEMIFPEIRGDFHGAVAEGVEDMNAVYSEFVSEIFALSGDDKAITYENEAGQVVNINMDRMREVRELYLRNEGMSLPIQNIMQISSVVGNSSGNGNSIRRHTPLLRVLKEYYSKAVMQNISISHFAKVAKSGIGPRAELDKFDNFSRAMRLTFGYNKRATLDALNLLSQEEMLKRSIEQEPK